MVKLSFVKKVCEGHIAVRVDVAAATDSISLEAVPATSQILAFPKKNHE